MQRNVAVKDPGAGGVRFDPSDHQIPAQAAQSRPNGSISPAKRHQSGSSGNSNGRKALSIKSSGDRPPAAIGRKALSISPSGTGDDHPANKLIVRTQKRLEAEEVPSQLKSA